MQPVEVQKKQENISMQDLKDYFSNYVSPSVSHSVGDIDQQSLTPAISIK